MAASNCAGVSQTWVSIAWSASTPRTIDAAPPPCGAWISMRSSTSGLLHPASPHLLRRPAAAAISTHGGPSSELFVDQGGGLL
jgi:hypothetical protein